MIIREIQDEKRSEVEAIRKELKKTQSLLHQEDLRDRFLTM